MNSSFKVIYILIAVLFALIIGGALVAWQLQPKIAYVRSHQLIEKFHGTVDARSEFEKRKRAMTASTDSLALDFERDRNHYISVMNGLNSAQRQEQERELGQRQQQILQYKSAIDQKISEEDEKMMQGVLNQINSFVEEYALKKHYKIILGTTSDGSLLFGDPALDVTDTMIKELNSSYRGK